MLRTDNLYQLPDNLPIPKDDGACDHLVGRLLPDMELVATNGSKVNIAKSGKILVLFCYPRTGQPDKEPPSGWNDIPGARGCTPQAYAFRDSYAEYAKHNVSVYGFSTQDSVYQLEAKERLHLPFDLLSDENLAFAKYLDLPTFTAEGMTLIKRLTIVAGQNGEIKKVFYPVFPPNKNAVDVISWIKTNILE